jgi:hypothetical protein
MVALLDFAIAVIPVLIFCGWQLVSVNRAIARDKTKSPDRAGHAVGEHRLDDR